MKAVGYVRVSTEEQAREGVSLAHQEKKIRDYCNLHDIELVSIVKDEGISAKDIESRPGARGVIDAAQKKEVEAVVVYKLDRLFRNAAEALNVAESFNREGVSLRSVTESIDTQSAMGKFFFSIAASFAEMERNLISERTRDALRYKKEKGEVYNHAPYGYRIEGDNLVPDVIEQGRIGRIRDLRLQGKTFQQIADCLNDEKIPAKRGGPWYPQTVANVLES